VTLSEMPNDGAASDYVLGIDIGTASSKAALCRTDGTIVARRGPGAPHLDAPTGLG
jgi:sugar (pentulose or hexulose) kinase